MSPRIHWNTVYNSLNYFLMSVLLLLSIHNTSVVGQDKGTTLSYRLLEEIPEGTLIGSIFLDAKLGTKYAKDMLKQLQVRLVGEPELGLAIEEDTDLLRVGQRIDRDTACPDSDLCSYSLEAVVFITDPLHFLEIIDIVVEFTDINDNPPQFQEPSFVVKAHEATAEGTAFVVPMATDADSGQYGIQNYKLVNGEGVFTLDIRENLDGVREPELILISGLNKETKETYDMKVIAYDGGNPPLSGSIDVQVQVLDTNDHDPVFNSSVYEVTISEATPPGTTIVRVSAEIEGEGSQVVYTLSNISSKAYGHVFHMNKMTGEIYTIRHMNYEEKDLYHLIVTAQGQGPGSRPADVSVIIRILDINDHAPIIIINTLGMDPPEVLENAELGTFIAHITVTDADSASNGQFTCSLDSIQFRLEQLSYTEYKIVTATLLDREMQSVYHLVLKCTDFGDDPLVSVINIMVAVADINDNAPQFMQANYAVTIPENNYIGVSILQVNATDADSGKNAEIRYSIRGALGDMFEIDPITGIMRMKIVMDYEVLNEVQVEVMASDQGTPALSDTATVIVSILDVNDEVPHFTQDSYSFGVYENEPPGIEVGVVHAIDADGPVFNKVSYYFIDSDVYGNHATEKFNIDPDSGQITTTIVLDREDIPEYHLEVRAANELMMSIAEVMIYVADKNDNPPHVIHPTNLDHTVHISNKTPVGYVFYHVIASDRDIGKNGNLSFEINNGDDDNLFNINPVTGDVAVNHDLNKFILKQFDLVITVKDQGYPQRSSLSLINVVIDKSIAFEIEDTTD